LRARAPGWRWRDERLEKIQEVAREIQKEGGAGFAMECDVTRAVDVERAVKGTVERFGWLNVLVNNAGALPVSTVEGISEEEWDRVMTVNVKGAIPDVRARCCRSFEEAGGGAICEYWFDSGAGDRDEGSSGVLRVEEARGDDADEGDGHRPRSRECTRELHLPVDRGDGVADRVVRRE